MATTAVNGTNAKPGYKTTEFWAAIAGAAIPIVNKIFGLDLPEEAIYTLIAYIVGRSGVKAVEVRRNK